jgi:hypothetical protein
MYTIGTMGIKKKKKITSWYIVWNFGSVVYWKCYGVKLSNKYLRANKLRVNEFVEMHTAAL